VALAPGRRLGPYEVVAPLGAGGMGEVYRARDTRLGREVALKVLPADRAGDPDRLRRFETEARAVAALSHPHILAVHDVGTEGGVSFVVFELLEGRTLRRVLEQGPLAPRRVVEYAVQACRALAAAHDKGIHHRDLKPENLMLTREGQVKVLDFGLAKLARDDGTGSGESSTTTDAGVVLGTAGYMSPEQARGLPADARSDVFSLGAVLYEMLAGRRAFSGDTAVDTLSAILHRDPPEITTAAGPVPVGLESVVRRCLEKDPQERFQSARDVAFALEALSGSSTTRRATEAEARRGWRRAAVGAAVVAGLALVALAAHLAGRRAVERPLPEYRRLTHGRGWVGGARFTADGQAVVYAAQWGDGAPEVYRQRLDSPLPHPLSLGPAEPVAAHGAEVALVAGGTLLRVPAEGGPPRPMLEGVVSADWGPGGRDLAIVRQAGADALRLEYPVGRVLREVGGVHVLRRVRVAPDGALIAAADHPNGATDPEGYVIAVDPSGRERIRSGPWKSLGGLAWSPDGQEIWFSAADAPGGGRLALHAVDGSGRARLLLRGPGDLDLEDVRPDGRVLVRQRQFRLEVRGRLRGDARERDLSLASWSVAPGLLPDGGAVGLLTLDEATGTPGAWLWRAAEGVPVRLADCGLYALSPDGRRVLCGEGEVGRPREFRIVPTGPGEATALPRGPIDRYQWGFFCPDSRRVVFTAQEKDRPRRLFVQDAGGGPPRRLTPEGVAHEMPRMRGDHVLSRNADDPGDPWRLYPLDGGEPRPMPWLRAGDVPVGWSEDARHFFLLESLAFPLSVKRLDLATGARQAWLETRPPDGTAVSGAVGMEMTPDGRHYVYTYVREPGELFVVEGLQ
jgi:eukaryotic-like serine/threonine-protein kinase